MTEPRISKTRRRIAWEAACLLLYRRETEIYKAKLVAGKRICGGWVPRRELPTNQEVQAELARLSSPEACLTDPPPDLLEQYAAELASDTYYLSEERPDCVGRWEQYAILLRPLENIRIPPPAHAAVDALFHSLQVFEHAAQQSPYDEEFLLAALLHEVGRAVDIRQAVQATLGLLQDDISPRTAWLILNLPEANKLHLGTIGHRSLKRLRESEDYEDLILLAECDRLGGQAQANVRQLEDALDYIALIGEM